ASPNDACVESPLVLAQPPASRDSESTLTVNKARVVVSGSFAMTQCRPMAIRPQQQRQHRATRQDQLDREIRAERAELLDDPLHPCILHCSFSFVSNRLPMNPYCCRGY